ncbi:MAG TPA: hypothetical protein DEA38_02575 [Stenotrophomonas sp.]|nr:hypothetical protein [Stenotrophomonas sp.]
MYLMMIMIVMLRTLSLLRRAFSSLAGGHENTGAGITAPRLPGPYRSTWRGLTGLCGAMFRFGEERG